MAQWSEKKSEPKLKTKQKSEAEQEIEEINSKSLEDLE